MCTHVCVCVYIVYVYYMLIGMCMLLFMLYNCTGRCLKMPVNRNSLQFCSWNIEGFSRKVADSDFISTINQSDFISLVETWISG